MSARSAGAEFQGDGEMVAVGPPAALRWNLWATLAWGALTILSNLELFGQRAFLRRAVIDANNHAGKNKKDPYTAAAIDHAIHSRQLGGLIESVLVVVILLLLATLAWRGRRWARWALLVLAVVGVPFGVGVLAQLALGTVISAPGLYKLTMVLAGFGALLVVVLLTHRDTRAYFKAVRETELGRAPAVGRPATGAGPRPIGGLGALFAPRRRAQPPVAAPVPRKPDAPARAEPSTSASTASATGSGPSDSAATDPALTDPGPAELSAPDAAAVEAASGTSRPGGGAASRRSTPTRPGSVKAKGGGPRPGRSKSRQQ